MLNVKVLEDFRCILWSISRDEAVLIGVFQMDFGANKKPAETIREGVFGGNYFRTFILVLLENGTKNHGKNSSS